MTAHRNRIRDDRGIITPRQHELIELIATHPGISTTDLAKRLGCSQTNVYDICQRLLRIGYLRRSGTLVIGPRCGCCPHCKQPTYRRDAIRSEPFQKLTPEQRRAILLSRGKAAAIALRFGVDESTVHRFRREARGVEASTC